MNRMHPQDLRAIVAACLAPRLSSMSTYQDCIDAAEILLRHMERTAEPEPEPEPEKHWSYWQKRCDKAEAALADAAKAERERIIAILVEEAPAYSERYFRAALEPKP